MIPCRQLPYALLFFCSAVISCSNDKKKLQYTNSSRYDLLNPTIIKLPDILAEISGVAFYPKDTSVFAVVDEDGLFYKINLMNQGDIKKWRFDKKHDYEDIVLHDSIFYILVSNGDIETLQFGTGDSIITSKTKFPASSKKLNEFESLHYDDVLNQLVLVCKNCDEEANNKAVAWGYNIETQAYTPDIFTIDITPALQKLGVQKMKLRPSATAINPVTNEIYILASINNLLVITDRLGKFKEAYPLDPAIYKQPEGIAFTPAGDMIISNESNDTGLSNILIIKNKKKGL